MNQMKEHFVDKIPKDSILVALDEQFKKRSMAAEKKVNYYGLVDLSVNFDDGAFIIAHGNKGTHKVKPQNADEQPNSNSQEQPTSNA